MNEIGIDAELYAEENELHEYWGAVNGNWFDGPNDYFYQIQNDAYSFIYNYIDEPIEDNGDVNLDGQVNVLDVIVLVNIILDIESGGSYCDINDDGVIDILDIIALVTIIVGN